jgi:hypothetical protein
VEASIRGETAEERVLVLAHGEREAGLIATRLDEVGSWRCRVTALPDDPEEASVAMEEAIDANRPALVLFVGAAVALDPAAAGEVVIADQLSTLVRTFPRVKLRRQTRRVDPDLMRHAQRMRATQRQSDHGEAKLRLGLVATGASALELWKAGGPEWEERFPDAVALDPSGWDFLCGFYDLVELPVLVVLGLVGDLETDTAEACARAATVAHGLLASIAPARLRADPTEFAAHEGEQAHLHGDSEILPLESTQRIVQRPRLESARMPDVSAGAGGTAKQRVDTGVFNAIVDPDGVLPEDLHLRIRLRDGSFAFELTSHRAGYHGLAVGETRLADGEAGNTAWAYRQNIKERVHEIALVPEAADVEELRTLGRKLYNDLFPPELKDEYAKFRGLVRTLLVTSDEPWIPWELARPHGEGFEDDFLCIQFAMTRWLAGASPKRNFTIRSMAHLEAGMVEGEARLESAHEECAELARLGARLHVEDLSPDCARLELVRTLLRRQDCDIHLWHVAAHGGLGVHDADEAKIVLEDYPWRANDLANSSGYGIKRARPLVFFNACLAGQQDWVLNKLGGWPSAWVVKNRCGGYIAPQWAVSSKLSSVFSKAFYEAVVDGKTLAEAARSARCAVRDVDEVDPTWLSYAVYGHPNATVSFEMGTRREAA